MSPLSLLAAGLAAAVLVPAPAAHHFNAAGAYKLAQAQVAFGPRPAGSAAQRRAADMLVTHLPDGHFESVSGGLRNIVGELPGRSGPAILLVAHYDTTDVPGYLGANNSAAAVGAVVELARALKRDQRASDRPLRFLLTDGEEAPVGYADFLATGLRGSRAYLAAHRDQIGEVIVLDFVGNRGLRLPREAGSDADLWSRLRAAARSVGESAVFPATARAEILDDHTPFARAGIPAIDLIDFDYPCWQKVCDTMSKVSARSIDAAGESVLALVRDLRR